MIVFLVVGLVLVGSGLWFKNYDEKLKNRCTEPITATVDGYHTDTSRSSDGTYSTYYFPVFKYTYDGVEYTTQSNYGSGEYMYSEGDEVALMINPDNAKEIYDSSNRSNVVVNVLIGIGLSIILFILVVLFGVYLLRRKKRELEDTFN